MRPVPTGTLNATTTASGGVSSRYLPSKETAINFIDILYFFTTILASYGASRFLQSFLSDTVQFMEVEGGSEGVGNEGKLFESLYIVPASLFTVFYTMKGVDIDMMKGDLTRVRNGTILIIRSWSIFLFSVFGLVISYAEESLVSTPIIIFTLLTSFCGYFILEPYMVSCYHVLSTLAWTGVFDLCIRTSSWSDLTQYPLQLLLASMLVGTSNFRARLDNKKQYNNISYQYIGIPIMLLMYWCFEIPGCEVLTHFFNKEVALCAYSNNLHMSSDGNNFQLFLVILLFQALHLCFGRFACFVFASQACDEAPTSDSGGIGGEMESNVATAKAQQQQQKRASRSASRLEGGRATSRDRDSGRDKEKDRSCTESKTSYGGRFASDSISSTDSESSLTTMSSSVDRGGGGKRRTALGASDTTTATTTTTTSSSSLSSNPSSTDFLPTLSLLTSLPLLSSLSMPFTSPTKDADNNESSTSEPMVSGSSLPSSSHLLNSLPIMAPIPAFNPWGFSMSDSLAPSGPPPPTRIPVPTSVNINTTAATLSPMDEITEAEAFDIVQKGLLHVKSLRAN